MTCFKSSGCTHFSHTARVVSPPGTGSQPKMLKRFADQITRFVRTSKSQVAMPDPLPIGRAVQQECRDRYRMPSSAWKKTHTWPPRARPPPPPTVRAPPARGECGGAAWAGRGGVWAVVCRSFFFNDTATTEIYTLSLPDALPIFLILF